MYNKFTNSDRMLQTVLSDEKLVSFGEYNIEDYETIEQALNSDNSIVVAVAKIINGKSKDLRDTEIYKEVCNYLKQEL